MPRDLVVGLHLSPGASQDALARLVEAALVAHHLAPADVARFVTLEGSTDEPALLAVAAAHDAEVIGLDTATLAAQPAPTTSARLRDRLGTGSVCEAGVLAQGAEIVVTKHLAACGSVAVGRLPA